MASIGGVVARVIPDSIASELGLVPGDRIIAVNGEEIRDIIDLSFALADEYIELLVEKQSGEQELAEIEKDYDEDLGIEFESAVFDQVRRCANKCIFCFVDQMPPQMRESLYVKDDDYRLSFLYGNFITLTNIGPKDIDRIKRLHLSPLYISVHTSNGLLREKMLGNKRASDIMKQIETLIEAGIEIHTQVVLCPGINDKEVLAQTIKDLHALHPHILSLAIVPIGLTRYRESCYPIQGFTPAEAACVIDTVSKWQKTCRKQTGSSFVYLGDEFYLAAGYPIPEYDLYDGFPQLENGVGIVRQFLEDWQEECFKNASYDETTYLDIICGVSAEKVLRPLVEKITVSNLKIRLVAVENKFFGSSVTVTGLLTGRDIIDALAALPGVRTGVIIPAAALRKGENILLDNITVDEMEKELKVPIRVAGNAHDLADLLRAWR